MNLRTCIVGILLVVAGCDTPHQNSPEMDAKFKELAQYWEKHWELHEKGDYQNALELLQTKMVPLEEQMEEMDPYAVYPEWWPYEKQRGFSFMELRIRSLEKRERELGIERTNQ